MGESIFVHAGEFETACPGIIRSISERGRARRSIFLLDQYGYTDIPFSLIKQIFYALPKSEVIFTFATDGLINYLCQANRDQMQRNLDRIGLPLQVDQLLSAGEANPDYRFYVESQLIEALRVSAGAQFFTPFFIVSAQSNRAYWLVHLSNHHRARDAMTQVHWAFKNHFAHYGGPGLNMLGYRAALDDRQQAAFLFNDEARRRTDEALLDELPTQIAEHVDGIAFRDFASSIANHTPAHNQILLEAVGRLLEARLLEVTSRDGVSRRAAKAVRPSDHIRVIAQRYFSFARPRF